MTDHSPEPWKYFGEDARGHYSIFADNGWAVLGNRSVPSGDDLRRIVACVNACAGHLTEELEDRGINLSGEHVHFGVDIGGITETDPKKLELWVDRCMAAYKRCILKRLKAAQKATP